MLFENEAGDSDCFIVFIFNSSVDDRNVLSVEAKGIFYVDLFVYNVRSGTVIECLKKVNQVANPIGGYVLVTFSKLAGKSCLPWKS